MFMNGLGGPALVRAYALELLVDAVRQREANRAEVSRRRLTTAFGSILRSTGRLSIRLSDWLAGRSVTAPAIDVCG